MKNTITISIGALLFATALFSRPFWNFAREFSSFRRGKGRLRELSPRGLLLAEIANHSAVCRDVADNSQAWTLMTEDAGVAVAEVLHAAGAFRLNGEPKFGQLEPARRLAASGRPSATSGVIAVGTLRPHHIWCNWLRWPSASYTELVTQVVAGQVVEHVHRLALLVPVAEVDRADCFCELNRSGV